MSATQIRNKVVTYFLFMAALFAMVPAFNSQTDYRQYAFIKKEYNRLYFSKDSSAFSTFAGRLSQLKNNNLKRITVVHVGGSHVQGGIWSNTFVNDLQTKFQKTGGGYFVFPYKIARTNGQPYARSFSNARWKRCRSLGKDYCQPLGMCAMNVSTNDSAGFFGARLTEYAAGRLATEVRVYHNFNPSYEFQPKQPGGSIRQDFREQGYSLFKLATPIDSVSFEFKRLDTLQRDFVLYGLDFSNPTEAGFYLAGLGANGASSASFLRCQLFSQQLATLQPDVVIFSLGVNDTQAKDFEKEDYFEHYDSLISIVKRVNPTVLIVLTTTTDNFIKRRTSNRRTIGAREAMFELMEKHSVAVWDLFSVMGGYKSMLRWNKAGLAARDKVHFTARGYTILGHMMADAVLKAYSNYQKNE